MCKEPEVFTKISLSSSLSGHTHRLLTHARCHVCSNFCFHFSIASEYGSVVVRAEINGLSNPGVAVKHDKMSARS